MGGAEVAWNVGQARVLELLSRVEGVQQDVLQVAV